MKQLRAEREICQKELAAYLNVSIGTISNYETGVHQPDLDSLVKIAEFYGVTTDYLLGLATYPYSPNALSKSITNSYTTARFFRLLSHLSNQDRRFLAYTLHLLEAKGVSSSIPKPERQ